mmetsp:Transcript_28205/g.45346  ORF Transcript_28205/g.45346 Transcript_28205/m.45346 type:complete len:422 (-) Transcript_28205:4417-5682(-)|eukprot:CAMPEP_0203762008 /NCGR_PEP_ID=MMETSP0098-20131031/14981_1 /ASSEMBLY_ACC=CAM_ASM_000208 /TAXON_ID=96639 /ORGANISM=" , Strain NY0313808BC1" /LENGTH=421 /DNA_ID=CAMNT_0050656241 /DNA_START=175 /DNA_END=1440 /DNA_ORIENTATION=+
MDVKLRRMLVPIVGTHDESSLPAEFMMKKMKIRDYERELEQVDALLKVYLVMVKQIGCVGRAAQAQLVDPQLELFGMSMASRSGSAEVESLFQAARKSISGKRELVHALEKKAGNLGNLIFARDRYTRKRDDAVAKLQAKGKPVDWDNVKYTHEMKTAHWDFEDSFADVSAELEFLAVESRHGIANCERTFVNEYTEATFRSCDSAKGSVVDLTNCETQFKGFMERREAYVGRRKAELLQDKLLVEGVVPLEKEMRRAGTRLTVTLSSMSAKSSTSTMSAGSSSHSWNEPRSSTAFPMLRPQSVETVSPPISPNNASKYDVNPAAEVPQRNSKRMTVQRGFKPDIPDSPSASQSEEEESSEVDEATALKKQGFAIYDETAANHGWETYIHRETGETFWIQLKTGVVSYETPFPSVDEDDIL